MKNQSPEIIEIENTESSNLYLQTVLKNRALPEFSSVTAHFQSAGRGQINASWHSEKHQNLTFSMVVYPNFELDLRFYISKLVSLAVYDVLQKYVANLKIKWPNDIYAGDKKMGGILIENSIAGQKIKQSIIGIGININQSVFPADLPNPISLKQITGQETKIGLIRQEITESIKSKFIEFKADFATNRVDDSYHKNLFRFNETSEFNSGEERFNGRITGTTREGFLLIDTEKNDLKSFDLKAVTFCL